MMADLRSSSNRRWFWPAAVVAVFAIGAVVAVLVCYQHHPIRDSKQGNEQLKGDFARESAIDLERLHEMDNADLQGLIRDLIDTSHRIEIDVFENDEMARSYVVEDDATRSEVRRLFRIVGKEKRRGVVDTDDWVLLHIYNDRGDTHFRVVERWMWLPWTPTQGGWYVEVDGGFYGHLFRPK